MTRLIATRFFIALVALLGFTACKTTTTTSAPVAWANPNYANAQFQKLYVIGVGEDDEFRRLFEDSFARALASENVVSEPSWKTLPMGEELTEAQIREAIGDGDFDAVLITFLVDEDSKPLPEADDAYYRDYHERYVEVRDVDFDPEANYRTETRLYSVKTGDLVWVGQSVVGTPSSVKSGVLSYSYEVAKTLKDEGLVRMGVGQGRTPGSGEKESL